MRVRALNGEAGRWEKRGRQAPLPRDHFRSFSTTSSETQGQKVGARESLNGRKNIYGTKKSKERREEPLGTMSYQTSSKRSPPFWLLIGARKTQVFFPRPHYRPLGLRGCFD